MSDLTKPIARAGEQIYCSIHRERSGVDSGTINPACRVFAVEELCDQDQKDIVSAVLMLAQMVFENTRKKNRTCDHWLERAVKSYHENDSEDTTERENDIEDERRWGE